MDKATGAEIRTFYYDNSWWGACNNWYVEEDYGELQLTDQNGKWLLDSSELYNLNHIGPLVWQGGGELPESHGEWEFVDAFQAWKDALQLHSEVVFSVTVPVEQVERFIKFLSNMDNIHYTR